jgi:phosphinothricin acetyltransferase
MTVLPMTDAYADEVLEIYRQGIDTGDATFETEVPAWSAFTAARLPEHRFVALDGDRVLGWVACSAVSSRPVYAGVVEDSVYVRGDARGRGVGRELLRTVIASTEAAGVWTIKAGLFPENTPSMALHVSCGFRVVGTQERVGRFHDGRWRDVVLLERRSPVVS